MADKRNEKPILLIALGGNALIKKGQEGTISEQFENLRVPVRQIARLSTRYRIIITHGNGPQVGNLLLQQECCETVPKLPLEILVAQTEGQIGYMIESTLDTELMALGIDWRPLVSLLTYVVVDRDDPAFAKPHQAHRPGIHPGKSPHPPLPRHGNGQGISPRRGLSQAGDHRRTARDPAAHRHGLHRHLLRGRRHPRHPGGPGLQRRGCGHRQGPGQRPARPRRWGPTSS